MPVTAAMEDVISTLGRSRGLEQAAAGADHLERADRVDGIEAQEVVLRQRVEVGVVLRLLGDAGVVRQRIDPAVARGDGGDLAAIGVLGHVALGDFGFGAGSPHGVGGRLGLLQALGAVEDHGLGAALGRADRDGRAETRCRARHQDYLAVEVSHVRVPNCPFLAQHALGVCQDLGMVEGEIDLGPVFDPFGGGGIVTGLAQWRFARG